MNYSALKAEIQTDPTNLGYSEYTAVGSDAGVAYLLNQPTETLISIPSLSKGEFLLGIAPAGQSLLSASDAIQKKWNWYLGLAQASETINLSHPTIQALLSEIVSDGLLTQEQVDAFTKRQATRAEVLFGYATVITASDVSVAVRGQ